MIFERPRRWRELAEKGVVLLHEGRYDEALDAIDKALRLDSAQSGLHLSRGTILLELGRAEEAVASYDRAIELGEKGEAHYGLGCAYEQLGAPERALEEYARAVALSPSLVRARQNLGCLLLENGRFEEARDNLRQVPPGPDVCLFRGRAAEMTGRFQEAREEYEHAFELAERQDRSDLLGHIAARLHELEPRRQAHEQLRELDQALEQDPEDAALHVRRGLACSMLDRLEQALSDLDRAVELDPELALAWGARGVVHDQMGHQQQAWDDLDRALDLDPGNPTHLYHRGLSKRLVHPEAAVVDMEAALALTDDAELKRKIRLQLELFGF